MGNPPSPNGTNGRQRNGQFAAGNCGGPGNPHGKRVAELRAILLAEVDEADYRAVVRKLVELAKAGELPAIRELLDRTIGKPALVVEADPQVPFMSREKMEAEVRRRLAELAKRTNVPG